MQQKTLLRIIDSISVALSLVIVIFTSWYFGGKKSGATSIIAALMSAYPFLLGFRILCTQKKRYIKLLPALSPIGIILLSILASLAIEQYSAFHLYYLKHFESLKSDWIPLTANASATWHNLWYISGLICMGFSLSCALKNKRTIRTVLILLFINSVFIATYGIMMKISNTNMILWEQVNWPYMFFATFPYRNHWVAVSILSLCIALGLIHRMVFVHSLKSLLTRSPLMVTSLGIALICIGVAMSLSRSGLLMILLLALLASLIIMPRAIKNYHLSRSSYLLFIGTPFLFLLAITLWTWSLDSRDLTLRFKYTQHEIKKATEGKYFDQRLYAYKHTLDMIKERPIWGWGLGNYNKAFPAFMGPPYRTGSDKPTVYYRHAHNDWLELISEIGIVGFALLLTSLILFARHYRTHASKNPISQWCFNGIALMILYSLIDFPFGNPAACTLATVLVAAGWRYGIINELADAK